MATSTIRQMPKLITSVTNTDTLTLDLWNLPSSDIPYRFEVAVHNLNSETGVSGGCIGFITKAGDKRHAIIIASYGSMSQHNGGIISSATITGDTFTIKLTTTWGWAQAQIITDTVGDFRVPL